MTYNTIISKEASKGETNWHRYDALLLMSFGGPEGRDDVIPFLKKVVKGRNVPLDRLEKVAAHYYHFNGVSPINQQNRELITALERELKENGIDLPIYFANRNWHPLIEDTILQMKEDSIQKALAFVTSGFSCYSSCRQYRENIDEAIKEVGRGAPTVDKIRIFYNHPSFIDTMVDRTKFALGKFKQSANDIHILFTAHSIPLGMAKNSDYKIQLHEASALVAKRIGTTNYKLVFQSRSGPPQIPWLEPDILDYIHKLYKREVMDFIIVPIGFISDHMEVMYDLDVEAQDLVEKLGMTMVRANTPGTHPLFIRMIRQLIEERMTSHPNKMFLGTSGPGHDICSEGVCEQESHNIPKKIG